MKTFHIVLEGPVVAQLPDVDKEPVGMSFEADSLAAAQAIVAEINKQTVSGWWRLIEPEPVAPSTLLENVRLLNRRKA